jgi:phage gpG-like protein
MPPLRAKLERLAKALAVQAPKVIGAAAERHFKQSFVNQGFTDSALVKWPKTKNGKANRVLKKTGLLMNSIRVDRADLNVIRIVAGGPQVPYARIHNEGGTIEGTANVRAHQRRAHRASTRRGKVMRKAASVKAHTRRMLTYMPKRQYMGKSAAMEANMRNELLKLIARTIKG